MVRSKNSGGRRKEPIGYGKMKKYQGGTDGFRAKAGGSLVRTRPATITFNRSLSTGAPMKSVGSRSYFANRLKSVKAGHGRKAAIALKRSANSLTRATVKG